MQSFQDQSQPRKINTTRKSTAHLIPHSSEAAIFWPPPRLCGRSVTRFMPFTKPPGSQKVIRYRGVEEKIFGFKTTRRARMSDSPGREGYKERSGEVRGKRCHHVEEKGFVGFLFRKAHDRPSSSHGSSSYRTNGKEMEKEKRKKKKKRRYKGNGWCISVMCPKL